MTAVFYIAATDRMSWGRGTKEWEAIAHALIHAGREATKVILFQVDAPLDTKEHQIYVNEMGAIVAPAGSEVKDLETISAKLINPKLFAYLDTIESILGEQ